MSSDAEPVPTADPVPPAGVRRGLVLGGGGVTGIAWEIGLLAGLAERGVDLAVADLVIGTSAGSIVGASLTGGTVIEDLYAAQLAPPAPEHPARIGRPLLAGWTWAALVARGRPEAFGARMGRLAQRAQRTGRTPTPAEQLAAIAARLPTREWSEQTELVVTAVDVISGKLTTFDAASGVPLVNAVAASCAVPGVYPPIDVGGRLYVDGGVRSGANADLAAGCDRVVALTPVDRSFGPVGGAKSQLDRLGVPHAVIAPDRAALTAIGRNVLNNAAQAASARAGREQAASVVDRVAAIWG